VLLSWPWPDFKYPLLMIAVCVFLIVGTLWLYIRPSIDPVALVRRYPGKTGFWLLILAAALALVYAVDESRS